jgi:hypothetical protein
VSSQRILYLSGLLAKMSIVIECLQRLLQCFKTLVTFLGDVGLVHFLLDKLNLFNRFL